MTKSVFAILVHVALASEEGFALDDDGLSLLQTRVHKHEAGQEPEYFAGAKGSLCEPDQVLTLAQCFQVFDQKTVPFTTAAWSIMGSVRSIPVQTVPSGCVWASGNGGGLFWNDEPTGIPNKQWQPICSKNGGRAAELASQGLSCQEPTCVQPAAQHLLSGYSGVSLPEIKIGAPGSVCEEACGILSYAQCAKASDTGVLEAINGVKQLRIPMFQYNGGGHSRPAVPSGCWIGSRFAATLITAFSPYDTPEGALNGWVSDSGVGVGWGRASPVCGVCTTTTTEAPTEPPTPAPIVDDDASAVGDPHMHATGDEDFDLAEADLQ